MAPSEGNSWKHHLHELLSSSKRVVLSKNWLPGATGLAGISNPDNHPFSIYENIKLGLVNYTLLGSIEHHGVFIASGHYVSYIRQNNKWYHCDDKHITETNLLTLSNDAYFVFYANEIDIGT